MHLLEPWIWTTLVGSDQGRCCTAHGAQDGPRTENDLAENSRETLFQKVNWLRDNYVRT